jgi:NAD(P)-dependent dehydrogenase (short-subunit alcohol dehydrogenase family)
MAPTVAVSNVVQGYALKRIAEPEEMAAAILFLTGPDSSFVSGITLAADGGRTYH